MAGMRGLRGHGRPRAGVLLVCVTTILVVALACSSSDRSGADQREGVNAVGENGQTRAPVAGFPDLNPAERPASSGGGLIQDLIAGAPQVAGKDRPAGPSQSEPDLDELKLEDVVSRDSIQAIFDPTFVTVSRAEEFMSDTDLVIGVSIDGESHAYSIPYLSGREVVNDTIGGQAVAVTWCPLCFSGIVFSRIIEGTEHTFGVSGKLLKNSLVMYDRESDTLWSQFLAKAVQGPLAGAKLELLPSQLTTWGQWKAENPDTLVLDTGLNAPAFDSYSRYYLDARTGRSGQSNNDERLFPKELVVGITGDKGQVAYALRHLDANPVLNVTFEGGPLVVAFNEEGGATAVYDRGADGRTLTFEPLDDPSLMTDRETGSLWNMSTGRAISGPLEGEQLRRVASFVSFWFAWSDFYPGTEVYTP